MSNQSEIILEAWRLASGCGTPQLQAAALAYAHLPPLSYWMYQLQSKADRQAERMVVALVAVELKKRVAAGTLKDHHAMPVLACVIKEVQYPITLRPWSGRQRAAAAFVGKSTWHDNKLCGHVESMMLLLDKALRQAESGIFEQVIEAC